MSEFIFLRGFVSKRIINIEDRLTFTQPTDEEVYLEGWSTAQLEFPLNENPHTYGSHQFNMWYIGWNDFVDNH
jgi:hypothetical protein